MKTQERDFNSEMNAIFAKHSSEKVETKPRLPVFLDKREKRFNVVKETETGKKVVEFGITWNDTLTAIEGRFKNTDKAKYHVVRAEAML